MEDERCGAGVVRERTKKRQIAPVCDFVEI